MRRIPELDGLRGLAAVVVVFFHISPKHLPYGGTAVDLFFVLSGYLITGIILRDGGSPGFLKTFYIRRGLRIWPIYYLLIAALFALGAARSPRALAYYLAYAQQTPLYLQIERPRPNFVPNWLDMNHTWTLAIEEQFYIIWPALLLAIGRHRVVWLSVALLVTSVAARCVGFSELLLVSRCDGLAFGALLAGLEHRGHPTRGWLALGVGLALWTLVPWVHAAPQSSQSWSPLDNVMFGIRIFAPALTFYGLVATVAARSRTESSPLTAWLGIRPLVYLGTISYGIYLYHAPFVYEFRWLARNWSLALPEETAVVAVVTLAVASASWFLVEKPILRFKDRWEYRKPAG